MIINRCGIFFSLMLACCIARAQELFVQGTIIDSQTRRSLSGATVTEKGTTNRTQSNTDGSFKLKVTSLDITLTISHIGYQATDIDLHGKQIVSVEIEPQSDLDEVIVIGYGEMKKQDLTGKVSAVNMEDLSKAPVSNFADALAGRVAGVQVTSGDGQPGVPSTIVIRGSNSVTQDNSPLFVVDGFPIEGFDINSLNTNEIASISILKDASSTAIYGARGANGVVVVTTKQGVVGLPRVAYDGFFGFQEVTKRMELMSPYEFVKLQQELNPTFAEEAYFTEGRTLESYRNERGIDWQDMLFVQGRYQNHGLSLSGGSESTKYLISASAFDQAGAIVNSGFKRYQGRINLDQRISKRARAIVNLNYSNSTQFGTRPAEVTLGTTGAASQFNLLNNVWTYRPTTGGLDEDLLINELVDPSSDPDQDFRVNPVVSAKNEFNSTGIQSLIANARVDYDIIPGLKFTIRGGVDFRGTHQEIFNNSQTRSGSPMTLQGKTNGPNGAIINRSTHNFLNENLLTYDKRFNAVHRLNIVGGATIQRTAFNVDGYTANQVPNENLGISGLDEGYVTAIQSSISENTLVSFLSRVNYTFKDRYLFTFAFRSDGSSKFAPGNRWGYFPSGAFAWRLKEEPFLKESRVFSDLKLRLSYGTTGNNRVSDFAYLSTITFPVNNKYTWNNAIINGSIPGDLGNSLLRWESTAQSNAGIDLSLFNNVVALELDYYDKVTSDLLLHASVPYSTGFARAYANIGRVRNNGVEIQLTTKNIEKPNFGWSTSFNISFNRNRILKLADGEESLLTNVAGYDGGYNNIPLYTATVNRPIAQFYGYLWDGIYQYSDFDLLDNGSYVLKEDVPDNGTNRANIRPGDVKYVDLNDDGVLNSGDNTIIGNPYPVHIGGFTNNFTFRNFDLNVFFLWSYGNDVYNGNRWFLEGGNIYVGQNQFATYANRWTPENQSNTYHRVNGFGNKVYSSRYIEDASFLRLKTVSLGYTLPQKTIDRLRVKGCRINTALQNIFTWTNYQGPDPEVSTKNSSPLTPGFDYSPYPRVFMVTVGLNLSL